MPSPFEWSDEMDSLFWECVVKIVRDDPRTDWSENRSLGYPFDVIREQVLAKGLSNFAEGHSDREFGPLTPDEKVLLYCFVNLKKHFYSCLAAYEASRPLVDGCFLPGRQTTVIDVGCGPATAILALSDLLPGRRFDYLGVDSAPAMRSKGQAMWQAALERRLIGQGSTVEILGSWEEARVRQIAPASSVLMVFSYFLPVIHSAGGRFNHLPEQSKTCAGTRAEGPLVIVYLNSTNELANRNYDVFRQFLGVNPDADSPRQQSIQYRKKKGGALTGEEFVHHVLCLERK